MPFVNPYARKKPDPGSTPTSKKVIRAALKDEEAKPSATASSTPKPTVSSNARPSAVVTNVKPNQQRGDSEVKKALVAVNPSSVSVNAKSHPHQKLSLKAHLKQELAELKLQQRLHKERLALHKQQKAQRKLQRKQQKERASTEAAKQKQALAQTANVRDQQQEIASSSTDSREISAPVPASNSVEVYVNSGEPSTQHQNHPAVPSAQGQNYYCPTTQPTTHHHLLPTYCTSHQQNFPHAAVYHPPSIYQTTVSNYYLENHAVPDAQQVVSYFGDAQQQQQQPPYYASNPLADKLLAAQHYWFMQQQQRVMMNYPVPLPYSSRTIEHPQASASYRQRQFYSDNAQQPAPLRSSNQAAPAKSAAPKTNLLAANPCEPPSPYAKTHVILPDTVVVVKTENEKSFGVTLKVDLESTLVDPDWQPNREKKTTPQELGCTLSVVENDAQTQSSIKTDQVGQGISSSDQKAMTNPVQGTSSGAFQMANNNAAAPANGVMDAVQPPRRKRRRRLFFSVVVVVDPEEQNKRRLSMDPSAKLLLQKDDIILSIAGKSTAGLSFMDACALFKNCSVAGTDGIIRCPVTVARRKPTPIAKPNVIRTPPVNVGPISSAATQIQPRRGPLEPDESIALALSVLKATLDPQRLLLGSPVSANLLCQIAATMPALSSRGEFFNFHDAWKSIQSQQEHTMKQKAFQHWQMQWSLEPAAVQATFNPQNLLTHAQRSALRALPRPPNKRCKCGSEDHQYVNDVNCTLYSNLRALDSTEDASIAQEITTAKRQKMLMSKLPADLKVVEKAYKDRLVRMKIEKEAEEAEAEFVSRMEVIQLKKCKQAIFAPSLAVMVLSAVAELKSEFDGKQLGPLNPSICFRGEIGAKNKSDENRAEDSEDDDVPLTALGKRSNDESATNAKRQRGDASIRYLFLARLAQYVSHRWGHVFQEPSNAEYTWRWEVYHGQTESSLKWDVSSNPRPAGSLSLENLRFVIDESVLEVLEKPDQSPQFMDAIKTLAHVLSPARTGLCDELLALIRSGVASVDDQGIPSLNKHWWTRVDFLLLEDMHERWSKVADPLGRYGVANTLRKCLLKKWVRTYNGWAFAQDEDDIVFDFEEFEEWRVAFEDKQQARDESIDGVGRFT